MIKLRNFFYEIKIRINKKYRVFYCKVTNFILDLYK